MQYNSFILPANTIYMCGHSLGPLTKSAKMQMEQGVKEWEEEGVLSWNKASWIDLPMQLGRKIAALIGAHADEVTVSDSTSVNLFKVVQSALALNPQRKIILTEADNFPANLYIAQGIAHSNTAITVSATEQFFENMSKDVAVLLLTQVNYRTGKMHDMALITEYAHSLGIVVVWDLSHSVGIVPVDLGGCNVDFAVGCTYKYLNGGPGAPSFVYINRRHYDSACSPIYGWMGHRTPFAFQDTYVADSGASKYLGGTPYVLGLKALEGALSLFSELDLGEVRKQCLINAEMLIDCLRKWVSEVLCLSPELPELRGGHIALEHNAAYFISRALIDEGLICDYRHPNIIRFCVNPLYLSPEDMVQGALLLGQIVRKKIYLQDKYQQTLKVT
jgi:kynureninase